MQKYIFQGKKRHYFLKQDNYFASISTRNSKITKIKNASSPENLAQYLI